jgi:hypothetical protein
MASRVWSRQGTIGATASMPSARESVAALNADAARACSRGRDDAWRVVRARRRHVTADVWTKGSARRPRKDGAVAREMMSAATVRSQAHDVKRSHRQH